MYPFLFQPNLHTIVWGGNKIRPYKGLPATDETIGESWEVSAVPDNASIIANGPLAGRDLISVVSSAPEEILGKAVSDRYNGKLPLLAKFIDAKRDLSIQVHPNDEMAARVHNKMGKSEMWYVIDAQPGSYLYAGFKQPISEYEFKKRVEDGSITDVLARHEVKRGDVFYLPAGRVHAICSGILLAEIQQSSDLTYRIFDYNRPGLDGRPRQLHVDLASQALDYNVVDEYRTEYQNEENRANLVISSPYFSVRILEVSQPFHRNLLKYDSFIITMCVNGDCKLHVRSTGDDVIIREGNSCLVPASLADYDLIPLTPTVRVLDAYIDNMDRSLGSRLTRFFHMTTK